MKYILFFLILIGCDTVTIAQNPFLPQPLPTQDQKLKLKNGLTAALTQNVIRPLAGISASIDGGTSVAGGVGLGLAHEIFDTPSQQWVIQYSASALIFLNAQAKVIAGLVFGFANGLIQIGPGYNFGTNHFCLMTGVGIKF